MGRGSVTEVVAVNGIEGMYVTEFMFLQSVLKGRFKIATKRCAAHAGIIAELCHPLILRRHGRILLRPWRTGYQNV